METWHFSTESVDPSRFRGSERLVAEASLALDDVVYPGSVPALARIDPDLRQDRHEARAEGIQLLLRVPDQAHPHLVARAEADLVVETICGLHLTSGVRAS